MQNFESVYEEHEKLINQAMFHLKIYRNFDEFYQLGRIALWEAMVKFDPTKSAFEPFAFTMIKFKMLKEMSQSTHISQNESVLEETQFQLVLDVQHVTVDEFNEIEWLSTLPNEEKRLLQLVYFEDKTNREIAKLFGCTEEAIKKRRQRLLKKLKEDLNFEGEWK